MRIVVLISAVPKQTRARDYWEKAGEWKANILTVGHWRREKTVSGVWCVCAICFACYQHYWRSAKKRSAKSSKWAESVSEEETVQICSGTIDANAFAVQNTATLSAAINTQRMLAHSQLVTTPGKKRQWQRAVKMLVKAVSCSWQGKNLK